MNILKYTREEIERRISEGEMRKENLKHYEICRALAEGKKQNDVADQFNVSDVRNIRYIKSHKCKDCR